MRMRSPPDFPRGLEAIHFGHLTVHDDDVVGGAFPRLDRFAAVDGEIGPIWVAGPFFPVTTSHPPHAA
jgi:hypothetical protein